MSNKSKSKGLANVLNKFKDSLNAPENDARQTEVEDSEELGVANFKLNDLDSDGDNLYKHLVASGLPKEVCRGLAEKLTAMKPEIEAKFNEAKSKGASARDVLRILKTELKDAVNKHLNENGFEASVDVAEASPEGLEELVSKLADRHPDGVAGAIRLLKNARQRALESDEEGQREIVKELEQALKSKPLRSGAIDEALNSSASFTYHDSARARKHGFAQAPTKPVPTQKLLEFLLKPTRKPENFKFPEHPDPLALEFMRELDRLHDLFHTAVEPAMSNLCGLMLAFRPHEASKVGMPGGEGKPIQKGEEFHDFKECFEELGTVLLMLLRVLCAFHNGCMSEMGIPTLPHEGVNESKPASQSQKSAEDISKFN